jgi:hypothetical protein
MGGGLMAGDDSILGGTSTTDLVSPAGLQLKIDFGMTPASETFAGVIEIADTTETNAGTDDTRAVTPLKLAGRTATEGRTGIAEIATNAETNTGTDDTRIVTPLKLNSRLDGKFNGSTNVVPKRNASGNYVDSQIRDDGTNAGIGATPTCPWDVQVTTTVGMKLRKTGSRDVRYQIADPTRTWSLAVGWAVDGDWSLIEEGISGNRLYVQKTTGNVGFGTSTPGENGHFTGAIRIGTTANSVAGNVRWTGTDFEGYTGTAWKSLTGKGMTITTSFYSDSLTEEYQGTIAADRQNSGNIVVTIPSSATINSVAVEWMGYVRNDSGVALAFINGGNIAVNKNAGAFTNFTTVGAKMNYLQIAESNTLIIAEGNASSVINGSGTYVCKFASLDSSHNGISLSGRWKIDVTYTL